jgi:hypothetical protein
MDNHWIQWTESSQPLEATVNGYRVVSFDGARHMLSSRNAADVWTPGVSADAEITLVARILSYGDNDVVVFVPSSSSTSYALGLRLRTNPERIEQVAAKSTGVGLASFAGPAVGTFVALRLLKAGGTVATEMDGTQRAAMLTGVSPTVLRAGEGAFPIALGGRPSGTDEAMVQVADVAVYATLLTMEQRAADDIRLVQLVSALNAAA